MPPPTPGPTAHSSDVAEISAACSCALLLGALLLRRRSNRRREIEKLQWSDSNGEGEGEGGAAGGGALAPGLEPLLPAAQRKQQHGDGGHRSAFSSSSSSSSYSSAASAASFSLANNHAASAASAAVGGRTRWESEDWGAQEEEEWDLDGGSTVELRRGDSVWKGLKHPPIVSNTFTVPQLEEATDGFGAASLLATGSYGDVHLGVIVLADGTPSGGGSGTAEARVLARAAARAPGFQTETMQVAIKVLKASRLEDEGAHGSGVESFRRELDVLRQYRHANIVALLGHTLYAGGKSKRPAKRRFKFKFARGGAEAAEAAAAEAAALRGEARLQHCIVLEYMAEGSLRLRLRNHLGASPSSGLAPRQLTARERFEVASDVARGLEFLHTVPSPPIIHQDVKSDNILLTLVHGQLVAKIADFGVARKRKELLVHSHVQTANITGSMAYMPLEFLIGGRVSEKTDAYAFGVVLCELLTGKPPVDHADDAESELLSQYMLPKLTNAAIEAQLPPLLDPVTADRWPVRRALALGAVARRCLNPQSRPRSAVRDVRPELDALAGRHRNGAAAAARD